MVWTSEIQKQAAHLGNPHQLGRSLVGVCLSGSREQNWVKSIYRHATKIMQECITLCVFTLLAYLMFGEPLKWNNYVSYALIIGAVYFSFGFN